MNRITFASVLLLSTAVFISCSPVIDQHPSFNSEQKISAPVVSNRYGAYLAGRIAHIRKDFDNASYYYKIAYQKDQNNPELINKLYLRFHLNIFPQIVY